MTDADCCVVKNMPEESGCSCSSLSSPAPTFVEMSAKLLGKTLAMLDTAGKPLTSSDFQCDRDTEDKTQSEDFKAEMMKVVEDSKYHYNAEEMLLTYPLMMEVMSKNSTTSIDMGTWSTKAGFKKTSGYQHSEIPRFFRIGTVPTTPWAYYELGTK